MSNKAQNILIFSLIVVVASLSLMPEKTLTNLYVFAGSLLDVDSAWVRERGWKISNVGHFLTSFLLAFSCVSRVTQKRIVTFLVVVLFLGLLESAQNFLPTRQASWKDFSYAVGGSLLGLVLVVIRRKG